MQHSKLGEHLYLTPRVPQGLAAAVEGLTREVIRHRPENIYEFAARHFENLLRLREQYGDPSSSGKRSCKQLHELNEAIRERHDEARQSAWSLNETAKVLEKHRSIFGDSGQKVSTEQIRELANEPMLIPRDRLQDGNPKKKVDSSSQENCKCAPGSSRRKECPQEASRHGAKRAPRILSQIPIAKDIKTELRRNRISSRERKKVVACEYTRETIVEKSSKKSSFEKTKRSSTEIRRSSRSEDSSTMKRTETTKSCYSCQEEKKFTRGASMDSARNYVVQNVIGMMSFDELQSPGYVERVQKVIDETSPVIKEKVEALRSGVMRAAKTAQLRKEASLSSEDRSRSSHKSDGGRREASLPRRNSKGASKARLDQDASDASESKSSLPAVRPLSSKSTSRSMSARSDSDIALTLPPISPESAKSPKAKEELVLPVLSPPRAAASLEDATSTDDTTAAVEEIAEDVTESSENNGEANVVEETVIAEKIVGEGTVSSYATTDEHPMISNENIDEKKTEAVAEAEKIIPSTDKLDIENEQSVLSKEIDEIVPPKEISDDKIIPSAETNDEKVAPFSESNIKAKVADDKTTVSVQSVEEIVLSSDKISDEGMEQGIITEKQMSREEIIAKVSTTNLLEVKEEEFHDSLDVTPEPFDTKGQRPDSLENSLVEDNSSGHTSPLETLKDKLLEIEEVQKRIEDVLDDTKMSKVDVEGEMDETTAGAKMEDKLIEIQESEKRIEQILDSQSTAETLNFDIKNKLQELEEAERRIESIFPKEITKEFSDITDATAIDVEDSIVVTTEKMSKLKEVYERNETTVVKTVHLNALVVDSEEPEIATRTASPHSYILTEGSPCDIPDSVTTVIIPERGPSPDCETVQVEAEEDRILSSTLVTCKEAENQDSVNDAFGEAVEAAEQSEPSTVDIEYIRGIKASHDMIVSRENLDRIKEERDEAVEVIDSEDEKVLRVVTSSLEEILEKEEVEYVRVDRLVEEEQQKEVMGNSLESTARSVEESTNEVKETSVTTDRSSLSLDAAAPNVPELNLDSLPDLTISSSNVNSSRSDTPKREDSLDVTASRAETQEFEKLEERLMRRPATASDIGVPAARDINNVVYSAKGSENNLAAASQCTAEANGSINANEGESVAADRDDDDDHAAAKKAYHIYVPEASGSKDVSSSSETSTFMSAATKIQAGVRGFLTRRRLQSSQRRSSTLDSVPSIQESFVVETTPALMPIVEAALMSEAKARKKLRREDAVQRTTLSVENAFAENQLQHTGEFHDCIPLPIFDAEALSLKSVREREAEKAKKKASEVERLLGKILLGHATSNFAAHSNLVDVVLLPADADMQNKYLNFITSVEDVFSDLPETPKGVIIEEITSLDESNKSISEDTKQAVAGDDEKRASMAYNGEETVASISTSEDPLSINIEEVLGLGEEDEATRKSNRLHVKLGSVDQVHSSSISQDSPVGDERTRSPVTMMMQIGPNKSADDKSDENPT
ncbi:uncharacterized protein LOC131667403 [Phymastichus coffea]|uniref:uncharacterized protein LOC131667403 n=1 Tax=Phymastichus coffea TaxID=108790 RepID=UPI00273A8F30|nr:uncharacterized protein LOC131667403 [Phymastichus coffea]